ncbi:amidophosphoribosyltransferase [Thiopseudomonas alkaliphila]|uniref:Amidophosphoribosyltransferase n=1 Tax=Thiopseudomonas alkaliphila TaxID=1697053 RepID=A0A0K1XG43_9GAMM|nr:amidophosphoribosyltransferase [Thiopseudomonas alkaliphila]AKX43672.1 amidophosphoribosyltransferase [Thiopseudomonas alkaliphila]AKX60137.1 amidophosphoribosyltransferase [Thiopseudomonas alkaliphila]MDM1696401.1 amidophosphoribosyltransferase [Thiopseudomonas alkaliphila]MDM1717099.1 amidophosphoribosyltransferase [Thiopseudomonas alkaliphila]
MCGIVGIVGKSNVNQALFDALTVLQHRGQDAAGMVTSQGGRLYLRKDNGLARDVFRTRHMKELIGNIGIAHVRYPTAGSSSMAEAQPFYVNSPYGITLAHNGNLTNVEQLTKEIYEADLRHVNTNSDSEVLLNVFAHELAARNKLQPDKEDVFATVSRVFERCQGGYAAVAMITGYGIVAFRDPNGIRPVVYGQRQTEQGVEYMVASESVALDVLGFSLIGDLAPGEALYITEQGELHTRQCAKAPKLSPCIFEYVYLARPDSILDGVSVYKARLRMGEKLAEKILRERPEHDIDVVIPIPDTSRTSALELANILGVKFREGFVKNRYIGRTFIMPGQAARKKSVRQKLNAIEQEFKGKNVMLVDDSIVRGTTCRQIIQMARDAGAKNVYFCSAAPAVRYPNVYGIDMPSVHELIAHNRTTEEVAELIGADWLLYQDLEDLKEAVGGGKVKIEQFDCAVFDGQYVTGDIDAEYLQRLEDTRNDLVKNGAQVANSIIELHNS